MNDYDKCVDSYKVFISNTSGKFHFTQLLSREDGVDFFPNIDEYALVSCISSIS